MNLLLVNAVTKSIQFEVWGILSQGSVLSYGIMTLELQGEIWVECQANMF